MDIVCSFVVWGPGNLCHLAQRCENETGQDVEVIEYKRKGLGKKLIWEIDMPNFDLPLSYKIKHPELLSHEKRLDGVCT